MSSKSIIVLEAPLAMCPFRLTLLFILLRGFALGVTQCASRSSNNTQLSVYGRYDSNVDYSSWQQQRIICKLLSDYDWAVRPVGLNKSMDGGGPVIVHTSVRISALSSFSDSLMQFNVQFRFRQEWVDPRLRFISEHKTSSYAYFAEDQKIWNPDTFFQNEKSAHYHLIDKPNVFTRVRYDGMVTYDRRLTMVFQCQMHLVTYPHDNQTCNMDFASYAYTTKDIVYVWHDHPVRMTKRATSALPQFILQSFANSSCTSITTTGTYSCLRVELRLLRVFSFFLLQLYIPSIMLVCVSYVSYWIDWRASPARVPLAIVTLLTMITQSHAVNSNLPPVSYTKAIDVWISGCIVFIFGSLIEYALVNYFGILDERRRVRVAKKQHQRKRDHLPGLEQAVVNISMPKSRNGMSGAMPRTENNILRRRRPSLSQQREAAPDLMDRYLYAMQRGHLPSSAATLRSQSIAPTDHMNNLVMEQQPNYYTQHHKAESLRCCHSMQVLSRAERIDMISRIIFPICFVGFNVVYWTIYCL